MPDTILGPRLVDLIHCPECGAAGHAGASRCWLCGGEVGRASTAATSKVDQRHAVSAQPFGFSLASLMLFVALLAVVVGVWSIAPGIGIPLGILLLAAWTRTVAVVERRAAKSSDVTRRERIVIFLQSMASSAVLLILITVVGGAALATAMFTACALDRPRAFKDFGPWALGAALVTTAAFWVTVRMIRYRRRAWRRDIGEPDEGRPLGKASRWWLKVVIALVILAAIYRVLANLQPLTFPRF
jgi:hypothetical protein